MTKALKFRPQEEAKMGLKAPGILTFMISVILTVAVIFVWIFDAQISLLQGPGMIVGLLLAQFILVLGCTMRGL